MAVTTGAVTVIGAIVGGIIKIMGAIREMRVDVTGQIDRVHARVDTVGAAVDGQADALKTQNVALTATALQVSDTRAVEAHALGVAEGALAVMKEKDKS